MKIVIVIFTVVISSPCFTPGVVGNDVTERHNSRQTITAYIRRQFVEDTTVPEKSKSSLNKKVKKPFKPVPRPMDTFSTIQRGRRIFVDKSKFIRKLIDEDGIQAHGYLLTRPRRFGKTVLLSMLEDFFEGREENFNDTEIQSRGNNIVEDGSWQPFPVIYVDFYGMCETLEAKDFTSKLRAKLERIANEYELSKYGAEYWTISALIEEMSRKMGQLVSVLIDNYDDPLTIPNLPETEKNKITAQLISFYSEIKVCSEKLRLVFIAGVSRLNKIHQEWNGFVEDITYRKDFWSITGFTLEEVKINFDRNIAEFASDTGKRRVDIEDQFPMLYGMYKFSEDHSGQLIPGSVCESIRNKNLDVYLPSTPAFKYVVKQMLERNITVDEFKFVEVSRKYLKSNFLQPDMDETIPLEVYMWFNGLLTINKRTTGRDDTLQLTYPCKKIEDTFREALLNAR